MSALRSKVLLRFSGALGMSLITVPVLLFTSEIWVTHVVSLFCGDAALGTATVAPLLYGRRHVRLINTHFAFSSFSSAPFRLGSQEWA